MDYVVNLLVKLGFTRKNLVKKGNIHMSCLKLLCGSVNLKVASSLLWVLQSCNPDFFFCSSLLLLFFFCSSSRFDIRYGQYTIGFHDFGFFSITLTEGFAVLYFVCLIHVNCWPVYHIVTVFFFSLEEGSH